MKIFLFLTILISHSICLSGTYEVSFAPKNKKIIRPKRDSVQDKYHSIIIKNRMMVKLIVQLITEDQKIIQSISLDQNKEGVIKFKNVRQRKLFLRPVHPASKLISLGYGFSEGAEVEIP